MKPRDDFRLGMPAATGPVLDHLCPICEGEADSRECYCHGRGLVTSEQAAAFASDDPDPRWRARPLPPVPSFTGRRCEDCAFRPDSQERDGATAAQLYAQLARGGDTDDGAGFYCHVGMHHGAQGYVPRQRDSTGGRYRDWFCCVLGWHDRPVHVCARPGTHRRRSCDVASQVAAIYRSISLALETPQMKRASLTRKTPMRRRAKSTKYALRERDMPRMAFVKTLPCSVGGGSVPLAHDLWLGHQPDACRGHIEAHHAGEHGYGQKPPDDTVIAMCSHHHACITGMPGGRGCFDGWPRGSVKVWELAVVTHHQDLYARRSTVDVLY